MSAPRKPTDEAVEVVTAPAGSGKTTLLLYHYLRHLQSHSIDRLVAITFTRKAAAELVDRLVTILRSVVTPAAVSAKDRKDIRDLFGDVLPTAAQARAALAALDSAPVGTVDGFTLGLVREHLLHACFRLSDGSPAYVDGPVAGGADAGPLYEAASRAELEELGPAAKVVLSEMTLGEAIADVAALARRPLVPGPTSLDLLDALGQALAPRIKARHPEWQAFTTTKVEPKAAARVAAWVKTPRGRPPVALLPWLSSFGKKQADLCSDRDAAAVEACAALGFTVAASPWTESAFAGNLSPWVDDAAVDRSGEVRDALVALARAARDRALRDVARSGRLGYDELLLCATTLCEAAPPALRDRYDVLMVDELQDTNPGQRAFYEAFGRMRRGAPAIKVFFVGDGRQSIFRFRQADPWGWQELVRGSQKRTTHAELAVNYRSSKALVLTQRVLAQRLEEIGEPGVARLDDVTAGPKAPASTLAGNTVPAPVLVVDGPELSDVEPYVIAELAQRLAERRKSYPDESAAVLVRTWQTATWAAATLREHGIEAQLTGDRALLLSRVAVDLRVLLAALLDVSDDVAIAGLLKHPSIGVTDRGLLLLRSGGGFGRLFDPTVDLGELDARDRTPLEAALPLLRTGRRRLGRESTADVLEWLVAELRWRPLVAAGPEGERGEGLAQLDILLDLIREWEAERVDPVAVTRQLAEAGVGDDLPVVQLQHGPQVVTVTTVYAAKGRQFDHVALLETHKKGSDGVAEGHCFRLGHPQGRTLMGTSIDPLRGLSRRRDPIAILADRLGDIEARAEGLRLFYVGFTRARLSVTFGIGNARKDNLAQPLRDVFVGNDALSGAVTVLAPDDAKVKARLRPVHPRTRRLRPFAAAWAKGDGSVLARATALEEAGLDTAAIVDDFRARAEVVVGPAAPPRPALKAFASVDEIVWGDVVHGWLDRWRFGGTPATAAALAYLEDRWRTSEPALAKWLVALGLHLRDQLPGFGGLLTNRLHFEWPVVGVDGKAIFRGRTDLVVELPGREVVILDFKAGGHVATATDIPGLKEYAPQLEAYRRMLQGAGYTVREVGLVYVRGPSWVRVRTATPRDARRRAS